MKIFATLLLMVTPILAEPLSEVVSPETITRVAFGACNRPHAAKQAIYDAILQHDPDVFVFLGDNIYGDTEDMALLKKRYGALAALKGYQKLQKQTRVLATWDDHDYGVNDGGNTYPMREASQQVFLDFFDEPADSVRRTRPGIYTSYSFGESGKKVQIILLDTRYFKDLPPRREGEKAPGTVGWYAPVTNETLTLLGETQWEWLEEQLQVPADVRILASSIQMLAYKKGMENWGVTPHEQKRLFALLQKHRANHTFAISGDVHFAEISKVMLDSYPFYDLTSSGMTHASKSWAEADNPFRVGEAFAQINAGLIEIDWASSTLTLGVINSKGQKVIQLPVAFSELEFSGP